MKKLLYLYIFLIAILTTANAQQMYRWTDSKGVVHYTELAPEETREQVLNFSADNPESTANDNTVKKVDKMLPTTAILVEVEEKKPFDPETKKNANKTNNAVAAAADPSSMTYCQTIHANIASFTALENGDVDSLILISQAGDQSPVSADDIQRQYKSTIDNLEQYCLQ